MSTGRQLVEVFGRRPGRMELALKGAKLAGIDSESKVLEVGCACGDVSVLIAETFGCEVTGVDIAAELINQAWERKHAANGWVSFTVADAADLPMPEFSFNYIISEAAFSLLGNQGAAVTEYYRVLKKQGKVIINDFFLKSKIAPEIQKKMDYIPCFYGVKSAGEYVELFHRKGFKKLYFQDCSGEIIRISLWLCKEYGVAPKELSRLFVRLLGRDGGRCECLRDTKTFFEKARLGYGQFIFQK